MVVVNARDVGSPSYYTYNLRFDHFEGSFLFRLLSKIPDTLKYLGSNKLAPRIGTNPVLAALALRRCGEVDCERPTLTKAFMSYCSPTGDVYVLSKEMARARKRLRDVDGFRRP